MGLAPVPALAALLLASALGLARGARVTGASSPQHRTGGRLDEVPAVLKPASQCFPPQLDLPRNRATPLSCGASGRRMSCPEVPVNASASGRRDDGTIDVLVLLLSGLSGAEFDAHLPKTAALLFPGPQGGQPAKDAGIFASRLGLHFAVAHRPHENRRVLASGLTASEARRSSKFIWEHFTDAGYATLLSEQLCPSRAERTLACFNALRQPEPCTLSGSAAAAEAGGRPSVVASTMHCAAPFVAHGASVQPCMKPRGHAHECSLRTLRHFWAANAGSPRFGFVAVDASGDERRGALEAVDEDVVHALTHFLRPDARTLAVVASEQGLYGLGGAAGHVAGAGGAFATDPMAQEANERPFAAVALSAPLREAHPDWVESLAWNAGLVTSHYDLYHTLREAVARSARTTPPVPGTDAQMRATSHSLLHPLPSHRGCEDAGVPAELCPCTAWAEVEAKPARARASAACVRAAADRTRDARGLCAVPTADRTLSVWSRDDAVRVLVRTLPGRAVWHCVLQNTSAAAGVHAASAAAGAGLTVLHVHRATPFGADERACDPAGDAVAPEYCVCRPDLPPLGAAPAGLQPGRSERAKLRSAAGGGGDKAAPSLLEVRSGDDGLAEAIGRIMQARAQRDGSGGSGTSQQRRAAGAPPPALKGDPLMGMAAAQKALRALAGKDVQGVKGKQAAVPVKAAPLAAQKGPQAAAAVLAPTPVEAPSPAAQAEAAARHVIGAMGQAAPKSPVAAAAAPSGTASASTVSSQGAKQAVHASTGSAAAIQREADVAEAAEAVSSVGAATPLQEEVAVDEAERNTGFNLFGWLGRRWGA